MLNYTIENLLPAHLLKRRTAYPRHTHAPSHSDHMKGCLT